MCLYTENIKGEVSNKPVTCYKVYGKGKNGEMLSYYTEVKYDLKEGDEVVAEGDGVITKDMLSKYWGMGGGFLHAVYWGYDLLKIGCEVWGLYINILRAIEDDSDIDEMLDNLLKVLDGLCWCEMEIPARERYWIGDDGDICAKRMIFKKEIKVRKKSELLMLIYCRASQSISFDRLKAKSISLIETYKNKGE